MDDKTKEILLKYVVLVEDHIAMDYGGSGYGLSIKGLYTYKNISKEDFDELAKTFNVTVQENTK